ncbi:MAG: DUF255 domain-containing protein [Candidatus Abyssobacteria bacterium SURF_17]|uniref:DUF255 domain-containing protein n=1 Tax=Candidatus Abyssobacteria bacterium SURF_17 TaxID=2093361 RepID=A0A419F5N7_9BACT|nr:MAG: DUF255 domain-containing protein [Candidatus Abyssubacteria bacterium SURF_17]
MKKAYAHFQRFLTERGIRALGAVAAVMLLLPLCPSSYPQRNVGAYAQEIEQTLPIGAERALSSESPAAAESGGEGFWTMLAEFDPDAFLARYGYAAVFAAMYLLGLGLTLTPCVYPIIPITVGYFGTQSEGRWVHRLAMALVFGFGVAVSYAAAGTLAALSGSFFGAALQQPWFLVTLATLCVAMGLNAFGVYELRLPGWLTRLASAGPRVGAVGAAIMGLTMGIAAASCLAAFVVSLLAFVGQIGNPFLGFALFLMLGMGLATPFVALAMFSGLVSKIPRSGAWLVYAKKVMGTLLFGAALYFLRTVLPYQVFRPLVLLCLLAASLYFAFFERTPVTTKKFRIVRLSLGLVFFAVALWWSNPGKGETSGESISWAPYSDAALAQAAAVGQPAVVYFHAEWCGACKELDRLSFSDPRVVRASRDFIMLQADMTRTNSPEATSLAYSYGIWGFPTIVFLGPDGREIGDLRIVQFVPPEELLDRFRLLKRASYRR